MGIVYIVASMVFAGAIVELVTYAMGDGDVGCYEYNFANGVGAVFGARN